MATSQAVTSTIARRLLARNELLKEFFARQAPRLAAASREMADRFLRGGRLLAFGRGPYATDAQHVAVEFVHPVIVGKRALPALDVSFEFQSWVDAVLRPNDIAMGFGPPDGDAAVSQTLSRARQRGAMTFALPGIEGSYAVPAATSDSFIHQELIEVLYHTLWETVHVFLDQHELGHDVGASGFLYPFLGQTRQDARETLAEVAQSILFKVEDDARLRVTIAAEQDGTIARAAETMADSVARGGKLLLFGNGGSATDANDWALDCVLPPPGYRPVPAISLALEPANLTAIANDVGVDLMFLRQIVAHGEPGDVAVAISTSGGSRNVIAALEEARRRQLVTVALLGHDGGEILRRGLADVSILVPSDHIPRVQEVQASIYHVIREVMEAGAHG